MRMHHFACIWVYLNILWCASNTGAELYPGNDETIGAGKIYRPRQKVLDFADLQMAVEIKLPITAATFIPLRRPDVYSIGGREMIAKMQWQNKHVQNWALLFGDEKGNLHLSSQYSDIILRFNTTKIKGTPIAEISYCERRNQIEIVLVGYTNGAIIGLHLKTATDIDNDGTVEATELFMGYFPNNSPIDKIFCIESRNSHQYDVVFLSGNNIALGSLRFQQQGSALGVFPIFSSRDLCTTDSEDGCKKDITIGQKDRIDFLRNHMNAYKIQVLGFSKISQTNPSGLPEDIADCHGWNGVAENVSLTSFASEEVASGLNIFVTTTDNRLIAFRKTRKECELLWNAVLPIEINSHMKVQLQVINSYIIILAHKMSDISERILILLNGTSYQQYPTIMAEESLNDVFLHFDLKHDLQLSQKKTESIFFGSEAVSHSNSFGLASFSISHGKGLVALPVSNQCFLVLSIETPYSAFHDGIKSYSSNFAIQILRMIQSFMVAAVIVFMFFKMELGNYLFASNYNARSSSVYRMETPQETDRLPFEMLNEYGTDRNSHYGRGMDVFLTRNRLESEDLSEYSSSESDSSDGFAEFVRSAQPTVLDYAPISK